jgi:SAM-dependent methyltransferase
MTYDKVAAGYDKHYSRPVDHWEDAWLARLLRPHVDGKAVLDLGCGTGWVMDHCRPRFYTGLDSSPRMLAELRRKHPQAATVEATVGRTGWSARVPGSGGTFDTVTATWALQYFTEGDESLYDVLGHCRHMIRSGGHIALHGCLPRRVHRDHYIAAGERQVPVITPDEAKRATWGHGLMGPRLIGTGATPDWLARTEALWLAGLTVPARWHYTGLFIWRKP